MKIYLDCYSCFMKQILNTCRLAGLDDENIKIVFNKSMDNIKKTSLYASPPEIAAQFYKIIYKISGNNDIYKKIKKIYNDRSLKYYPKLKEYLQNSKNKLLTGLKISAAGNIIDFGVNKRFDLKKEVLNIKNIKFRINHINYLKKYLKTSKRLLIIGDNCGEIVFDKILIELLQKKYKNLEIIYSVRGKPAINDALYDDAQYIGLTKICKVITNGTAYPGTVINKVSKEFKKIFYSADIIISKGQGNFETLDNIKNKKIFFLLKVKCDVVARHLKTDIGDIVFKTNK